MNQGRRGLESSIWASNGSRPPGPRAQSLPPRQTSKANASPPPQRDVLAHSQALRRFEQACGRLRWKFIDLESAYKRVGAAERWAFAAADAERNFKVDFHEFYAWIEQAVVLLLSVFGTVVEGARDRETGRRPAGSSAHAYHHNVLRALGDASHPLHPVLGCGDVNQALWKAKELRNRWKDAAEGRETPPLRMYDLHWIVTETMRGLEEAYQVALVRVNSELEAAQVEASALLEQKDQEWDWMVDPMDWEACL
ncbi:hypothetical protein HIM_03541 [Hirsutella minnesotensis 3608]|uniref:Uncharacterized protein n=1 Tax=Hirsutella minnesotensis 3608 TaxID=1043627 RepID=A0A0F7ZQG7_9HYPO|nr:hypothetical protein HIM_03541 [Hirsutella minnesotensis 3608]